MIKRIKVLGTLILLSLILPMGIRAQDAAPLTTDGSLPSVHGSPKLETDGKVELTSGTYAVFHTSEGDFITELNDKLAPRTVKNFVDYATGAKSWRHPVTLVETTRPLYSNTTIYRTIPNSMISGGDPINRGEADSGTQLPLEVQRTVGFDQPGLLAMDSSGDKMSGSRWFITLRPFPERTGNYTIFGKVIGGLDLVQRISLKPVKRPQLPLDPVLIYFIEVVKVPAGRVTTGQFRMESGLKVLRIDPDFKDAPVTPAASQVETPFDQDETTGTEEASPDSNKSDEDKNSDDEDKPTKTDSKKEIDDN